MKIRKLKSKQILLLYLLKLEAHDKIVSKEISSFLIKSHLFEILIKFKQTLQVIFRYHKKNRSILFVGLPNIFRIKINNFTNHRAFSKYFNFQRIDSDKSLFKGKKPDLIVLIDHINIDSILKEKNYRTKTPLIYHKSFYFLKHLFFLSLNFLFK